MFRELDVSANGHLSMDQFATIVEDYLLSDPLTRNEDLMVAHCNKKIINFSSFEVKKKRNNVNRLQLRCNSMRNVKI